VSAEQKGCVWKNLGVSTSIAFNLGEEEIYFTKCFIFISFCNSLNVKLFHQGQTLFSFSSPFSSSTFFLFIIFIIKKDKSQGYNFEIFPQFFLTLNQRNCKGKNRNAKTMRNLLLVLKVSYRQTPSPILMTK